MSVCAKRIFAWILFVAVLLIYFGSGYYFGVIDRPRRHRAPVDGQGHASSPARDRRAISDPLMLQWWGDRASKVMDPNGYEIWFYTNVAEPVPPVGAKLV